MDDKLHIIIDEYFKNHNDLSEEEVSKKMNELINEYYDGSLDFEESPLMLAYDKLEEASYAKSKTKAIKLAKEALEICPDCLDATLFLADLEYNTVKKLSIIEEGLEKERVRLEKENYFDDDSIGSFYGIYETRSYIRGLFDNAMLFAKTGRISQSKNICLEILRLNENDNMGARFLLMALYSMLEDEEGMLKLYEKYPYDNLFMLMPFFVLYYKKCNDEKANEYLDKIKKCNKHFMKFFKGTIEVNERIPEGYYRIGDSSEVLDYFYTFKFFIDSVPFIDEYILFNSKKNK